MIRKPARSRGVSHRWCTAVSMIASSSTRFVQRIQSASDVKGQESPERVADERIRAGGLH